MSFLYVCVTLTIAQDPALLPTFPEGRNVPSENQYCPSVDVSNGRSTQKRGYVFDPEEVAAAHGGFVKKYKKGL